MNDNTELYDYKIFLKENKNIILTSTVFLLLLLFVSFIFFINRPIIDQTIVNEDRITDLQEEVDDFTDLENFSEEEVEIIADYLNKYSYVFRIYIENIDDRPFTNDELLEEILTSEEIIQSFESSTPEDIELSENLLFSVSTIPNSELLQIKIGSEDKAINQKISNLYFEYIKEGNVSLFSDKTIYFIDSEPVPYEELYIKEGNNSEMTVDTEQEVSLFSKIISNLEGFLIVIILGSLGGFILGIFISLIKERLNKKIPSIYNFENYRNIKLISLDSIEPQTAEESDKIITQAIIAENKANKLILSETDLNSRLAEKITRKVEKSDAEYSLGVSSIEEFNLDTVEEIIILIQIYGTSKMWFEKQMVQLKVLKLPITVIRMPITNGNFK